MSAVSREDSLAKQVAELRAALKLAREASKDARRAGRAEALAILLALGAERINDFIGSHSIADSGEYGDHWKHEKLRELLDLAGDDPTLSLIDRLDSRYWDHVKELDELRERVAIAQSGCTLNYIEPPAGIPGNTYESITAALDLPDLSGDCTQRINQLIERANLQRDQRAGRRRSLIEAADDLLNGKRVRAGLKPWPKFTRSEIDAAMDRVRRSKDAR